jgi:hypothetical protein
MKPHSIACLLSGNKHIYWILGLEGKVHSIWVLWTRWPSRMHGQPHFEIKLDEQFLLVGFKKFVSGAT